MAKEPLALIGDKDLEECRALQTVLKKFGINSVLTHTAKDFVQKMKENY
jgi:hypothetical protein